LLVRAEEEVAVVNAVLERVVVEAREVVRERDTARLHCTALQRTATQTALQHTVALCTTLQQRDTAQLALQQRVEEGQLQWSRREEVWEMRMEVWGERTRECSGCMWVLEKELRDIRNLVCGLVEEGLVVEVETEGRWQLVCGERARERERGGVREREMEQVQDVAEALARVVRQQSQVWCSVCCSACCRVCCSVCCSVLPCGRWSGCEFVAEVLARVVR